MYIYIYVYIDGDLLIYFSIFFRDEYCIYIYIHIPVNPAVPCQEVFGVSFKTLTPNGKCLDP